MNKVLITGGNGFVGRQLIQYLKNQYAVRALVRSQNCAEVENHRGDLTQPASLKGCCDGISTIFHLAGYAHTTADLDQHHQVNYLGTLNLLQEALRAGVKKFIFISSVKATENSPYGNAKRCAEELLLQTRNISVVILRPALVYGPHWKGNLSSMMHAIHKGFFLPLPKIHNRRSMISVYDLCELCLMADRRPEMSGKIYTVSDGHGYSSREIYEAMLLALNKKLPRWYVPYVVFKILGAIGDILGIFVKVPLNSEALTKLFESAYYDDEKLKNELAFNPKYTFHSLLPEIVHAYQMEQR